MSRHFTKEGTLIANKQVSSHHPSLGKYQLEPQREATVHQLESLGNLKDWPSQGWTRLGMNRNLHSLLARGWIDAHFRRTVWKFLQKLNTGRARDLTVPLLGEGKHWSMGRLVHKCSSSFIWQSPRLETKQTGTRRWRDGLWTAMPQGKVQWARACHGWNRAQENAWKEGRQNRAPTVWYPLYIL